MYIITKSKILLIALIFEKIRIIIIAIVTLIFYGTYPCFIHSKNFKEIKNQKGTVGNRNFLLGGGADKQIGRLVRRASPTHKTSTSLVFLN